MGNSPSEKRSSATAEQAMRALDVDSRFGTDRRRLELVDDPATLVRTLGRTARPESAIDEAWASIAWLQGDGAAPPNAIRALTSDLPSFEFMKVLAPRAIRRTFTSENFMALLSDRRFIPSGITDIAADAIAPDGVEGYVGLDTFTSLVSEHALRECRHNAHDVVLHVTNERAMARLHSAGNVPSAVLAIDLMEYTSPTELRLGAHLAREMIQRARSRLSIELHQAA